MASDLRKEDVDFAPPGRAPTGSTESRHTVLVADDEPTISRLLARVLAAAGYRVHTAGTGEEVASLLEREGHTIDLALIDLRMPGRCGLDVYGDVRLRFPRIRVIFMSGYPASTKDYRRLNEWGATLLRKPFSIRDVEQRVDTLLQGRLGD